MVMSHFGTNFFSLSFCIKLDQVLMMGKDWKMMKEVPSKQGKLITCVSAMTLQSEHIVYLHVLKQEIASNVCLSASILSFIFHPSKIHYIYEHLHMNKIWDTYLKLIIQGLTQI